MPRNKGRCAGCGRCEEGLVGADKVLDFAEEDEMAEFWAHHALGASSAVRFTLSKPAERELRLIQQRVASKKQRVTMMMDPWLKQSLEELAAPMGLGYQTLAQVYLSQRVTRELRKRASGSSKS